MAANPSRYNRYTLDFDFGREEMLVLFFKFLELAINFQMKKTLYVWTRSTEIHRFEVKCFNKRQCKLDQCIFAINRVRRLFFSSILETATLRVF